MPVSTNAKLTPIIPFDLILDTDYGLIQLIKEKYYDTNVFNGIIKNAKPKQILYFLCNRSNINPLFPFVYEKCEDLIDSFYKEFIEKEYVSILKKSIVTDFFNLVKLFNSSDGAITPIILCRNELEESYINRLSKVQEIKPPLSTIVGDYDSIDVSIYDPIYFKYYTDTLKVLDKLNGKNLYIANYGFNFQKTEDNEKILLPDISLLLLDHNIAKITDIYSIESEDIPE